MGELPMNYNRWDILLADVPFDDQPETKVRPVLVLGEDVHVLDCLKMTSKPPRPGEYLLRKWSEAGLRKPTVVRIGKRLSLGKCRIRKKIGTLHPADAIEIENRMR